MNNQFPIDGLCMYEAMVDKEIYSFLRSKFFADYNSHCSPSRLIKRRQRFIEEKPSLWSFSDHEDDDYRRYNNCHYDDFTDFDYGYLDGSI